MIKGTISYNFILPAYISHLPPSMYCYDIQNMTLDCKVQKPSQSLYNGFDHYYISKTNTNKTPATVGIIHNIFKWARLYRALWAAVGISGSGCTVQCVTISQFRMLWDIGSGPDQIVWPPGHQLNRPALQRPYTDNTQTAIQPDPNSTWI